MKSILFAFLAIILYSLTSLVIEQKLGKYNTLVLTVLFTVPYIPIAIIFLTGQKMSGEPVAFPTGGFFWLALLLGALYFAADYFYLGAFTSGGDVMTIATIMLLGPVIIATAKHFWVGGYPNAYQIVGYLLVAVAVLFITKGAYDNIQ